MRPDGPVKDITAEQKKLAQIAGVPADRPGLGAEYPKMVYKPGDNPRHMHLNEPLAIGNGKHDKVSDRLSKGFHCETAFVDSAEDEMQALEEGWFLSPFPEEQEKQTERQAVERAKDDRIAELEAQLAAQSGEGEQTRRGPGRPPKVDAS